MGLTFPRILVKKPVILKVFRKACEDEPGLLPGPKTVAAQQLSGAGVGLFVYPLTIIDNLVGKPDKANLILCKVVTTKH